MLPCCCRAGLLERERGRDVTGQEEEEEGEEGAAPMGTQQPRPAHAAGPEPRRSPPSRAAGPVPVVPPVFQHQRAADSRCPAASRPEHPRSPRRSLPGARPVPREPRGLRSRVPRKANRDRLCCRHTCHMVECLGFNHKSRPDSVLLRRYIFFPALNK